MSVDTVFREFLSGRRSFESLREELEAQAASSGLVVIDETMADLVNKGRLPKDLAQILRASLGPASAASNDADWLDPPTNARPAGPRNAMPSPGVRQRNTTADSKPVDEPPLPEAKPLQAQVDEVILSALTGDFKAYRQRDKGSPPKSDVTQDRMLDSALESFRGVRLRRDAVKASKGSGRTFDPSAAVPSSGGRPVGIGTILKDRFVLDREIGRGGMGTVYRAVDRRRLEAAHQQPYVAIKLLSNDIRRSPEAFRSLESEARKVQDLAHPNIVTIFDFDRDGANIFIVMELLQGKPLDAVLREPPGAGLGFDQSKPLVEEICRGLAYAHERGVIHCDLKPANVFIVDAGPVKILDFGLAIASRGGVFEPSSLDGYTIAYASPEILEGAARHPGDDVYALGCLVYVILTGSHPFGRISALEARDKGMKLQRPKHIPRVAWRCLSRALSFDRANRQPDAEAFRRAYFDSGLRSWFR